MSTAAQSSALNVFLDCQDGGCDFDYFRTEITAVNWVRDREVADVHILITRQSTGSGGTDFTATFIGLRQFAALVDTLHYVMPPASTDDEQRKGLARMFAAGLVRYVARTPAGDKMSVSFGAAAKSSAQQSTKADPWKAWVFRLGADGYTFAEETYRYYSVNARLSANRVTEQWKTQISVRENYSQDEFDVDDTTTAVNIRRNYNGSLLQVMSLNAHWSAGLRSGFSSSTYENTRRSVRLTPAIEYNVFPYSQSTRRQIRLEYGFGFVDYAYKDTTIYDKLEERLPLHRLSSQISARQPWGSVDMGSTFTGYFHDRSKYRISTYGGVDIRIFKGFNVNLYGGYDVIHDQFSLAKKDYTAQEILLRQFQRGTTYSYYFQAGMSYTFGSIFNNVVNPRFD